jgi:hypothetical protein
MAEKSASLQEAKFPLKDRPGLMDMPIGTLTVSGASDLLIGYEKPIALHIGPDEDLDTATFLQDEVIRELATKLAEARRDLESLRRVEGAPVPTTFILNPIRHEQLRFQIQKIERAKFHFVEDE